MFTRHVCGFVLADIPGRGWCTPSGHLEAGETPLEGAVRETWEEIGARLDIPRWIGCYRLANASGPPRSVPAFLATVDSYGAVPAGSESRGVRCVQMADLPSCYWRWDALLEAVFQYADTLWKCNSVSP